ncbi:hypothetical protein HK101_000252 [Irineochytrium annulatum]|nr:hypothetical protein HK101_000252 [Irineochytrium annulatum]
MQHPLERGREDDGRLFDDFATALRSSQLKKRWSSFEGVDGGGEEGNWIGTDFLTMRIPAAADKAADLQPTSPTRTSKAAASPSSNLGTESPSASPSRPVPPHRCVHIVQKTDTFEGLCIQYACQVRRLSYGPRDPNGFLTAGEQQSELKRVNKLWTNDSIHLRKTLMIPHPPEQPEPTLFLRHPLSAHPANMSKGVNKRAFSTATSPTKSLLAPLTIGNEPRAYVEEPCPLASIAGSAGTASGMIRLNGSWYHSIGAKSIEDLLRKIDEDVENVCEALATIGDVPINASELLDRSETARRHRDNTGSLTDGQALECAEPTSHQYPPIERGTSDGRMVDVPLFRTKSPPPSFSPHSPRAKKAGGIGLISSSTTRVRIVPIAPPSPPLGVARVVPTSPVASADEAAPQIGVVFELTPLLRRLPVAAQAAVTEDVRRRVTESLVNASATSAAKSGVAPDAIGSIYATAASTPPSLVKAYPPALVSGNNSNSNYLLGSWESVMTSSLGRMSIGAGKAMEKAAQQHPRIDVRAVIKVGDAGSWP